MEEPFRPFRIFTPSPILGYGYDETEFWDTIHESQPAAIILDSGSTDPGPYLLGTGKTLCSRQSYVRDLQPILKACSEHRIKLLISSAGGAGTNAQVDFLVDIIREIAETHQHHFKLAAIKFKDDRSAFTRKLHAGAIYSCSSSPLLAEEDLRDCVDVVAQMGAEPFLKVLEDPSIDIIIGGRSYDPSPFAAFCMHSGVEESTAWHVGKIIECGGLCAIPKGRSIVASMFKSSFALTPTDRLQKCTPVSVAAHTLYEKTRPDRLPGPGGVLHLDDCTYTAQPDERSVLVQGSRFVPTPTYQLKLEGAEHVGFRSTFIGGVRDPILIAGIHDFLDTVKTVTKKGFPSLGEKDGPQLIFHLYGINAVMGEMETVRNVPHEIGVMGEVVADTQDTADALASFARTAVLHGAYKGQLATGGNLASPLTPLECSMGPVFQFSVYHLMDVDDPVTLFPVELLDVGKQALHNNSNTEQDLASAQRDDSAMTKAFDSSIKALSLSTGTTNEGEPKLEATETVNHRTSTPLQALARVIRSKNAGPFEVTFDVLFETPSDYRYVKASGILTSELIISLYQLKSPDDIVICMFYEPALAWKCTIKRYQAQGSVGERDTFGAQMHAPLLTVVIPGTESEANASLQ